MALVNTSDSAHFTATALNCCLFHFSYCSLNCDNNWNLLQSATMPSCPMVVHGMMLSAYELNLRLGTVLSSADRFFRAKLKRKGESTTPCDIPRSPMRMAFKFVPRPKISAVVSIKALDKSWHLNSYFRLCFLGYLNFHYFFSLEARTEGTHSMLVLHVDGWECQTCPIKLHTWHRCALGHPLWTFSNQDVVWNVIARAVDEFASWIFFLGACVVVRLKYFIEKNFCSVGSVVQMCR